MNQGKPLGGRESRRRTTKFTWWVTGFGAFWFLLGFALYYWHFHSAGVSNETKDWGDFGVFIGGFSGTGIAAVTLFAVAYGIRVQAEDLARSRAFMEKQSDTMAQQAFDSVFFNLLNRFSQVRDSVSVSVLRENVVAGRDVPGIKEVTVKGRQAFEEFYRQITVPYKGMIDVPDRVIFLRSIFLGQYRIAESELGPYFRTLYQIFKYIDRATVTDRQKMDYATMARAQLSDLELCVIFYDGLTDMAVKFKPLIEKYGILKHVNAANLLFEDDKRNRTLYRGSAFEETEA